MKYKRIFMAIAMVTAMVSVSSCIMTASQGTLTNPLVTGTAVASQSPERTPKLPISIPPKKSPLTSVTSTITPNKILPTSTSSILSKTFSFVPTVVKTVKPELVKMCPAKQIVPPKELGLTSENRLILSSIEGELAFFDPATNTITDLPTRAENSPLNLPFWFQTSPDGKWFAYYTLSTLKDELNPFDLWVSSIDGKRSWRLAESLSKESSIKWDRTDWITVWISEPDINSCDRPWFRINPFTIIAEYFDPKYPQSGTFNCAGLPNARWISPDYSKYVFYSWGWKIFDYPSGNIQNVFPWLPPDGVGFAGMLDIHWSEKGITILLPSSTNVHNFQFVLDLPVDKMLDQEVFLTEVDLQEYYLNLSRIVESIYWWSEDGYEVVVLLPKGSDQKNMENDSIGSFAILDLSKGVVYDYCYDKRYGPVRFFSSPDGRFLAWTENDTIFPHSIVILDKTTGKTAIIESEYLLVGWGMKSED